MRTLIALGVFLLAVVSAESATLKVGASDLLTSSERAYNAMLAAARQQGGRLDPANPRHAPFWNALSRMGQSLQSVRVTLESSDPQVFEALRAGSRTLAEMRVTWSRIGAPVPEVETHLASLASAYRLLRSGYGREGLRERRGNTLAEEEQRWLARWQDSQQRFAEQLRLLAEAAAARGDYETVSQLEPLLADAERVGEGDPSLDTYLEASLVSDTEEGEWEALREDLAEEYPDEWQAADAIMDQISVESEVGFVLAANLGEVAAYLDENGEIVEDDLKKENLATDAEEAEAGEAVEEEGEVAETDASLPPTARSEAAPERGQEARRAQEGTFRLFAGRDAPERFRLFSPNELTAPASYWLQLASAASSPDRHGQGPLRDAALPTASGVEIAAFRAPATPI